MVKTNKHKRLKNIIILLLTFTFQNLHPSYFLEPASMFNPHLHLLFKICKCGQEDLYIQNVFFSKGSHVALYFEQKQILKRHTV